MASNNGQSKPSPNHSASNLEHPGTLDSIHHHRHDHQRRNINGSFVAGLDGGSAPFRGSIGGSGGVGGGAGSGKMSRHQYISDNFYHNPHAAEPRQRHHSSTSHHMQHDSLAEHQMALGQGSRGGTLTLHSHRHHQLIADHPLDHHHHQFSAMPNHNTTSSLTYAHHHHHSRTHLLHQSNHHQSSHHLASIHQAAAAGAGHQKGGTMNSIGTHNSAHHHAPSPATPNTSSSHLHPPNMHDGPNPHHPMVGAAAPVAGGHHVGTGGPIGVATVGTGGGSGAGGIQHGQHLPSLPGSIHNHGHLQAGGLPSPPVCHNDVSPSGVGNPSGTAFPWPPSRDDCFGPDVMDTPGSTMNSRSTNGGGSGGAAACAPCPNASAQQPIDRWLDLGASSHFLHAYDWYGSYNWDYLSDWKPEHHNLMPYLIEKSGC